MLNLGFLLIVSLVGVYGTDIVPQSENATPYTWTANWGLTSSQLQAYLAQYSSSGYMPVDLDGYVIGGVVYFSIIAEQKPGAWSVQYNLTAAAFNATNQQYTNMGYHLQRISVYDNTRGVANYAGIWVNTAGFYLAWQFNSGLAYNDLYFLMQQMTGLGYWPIQVEQYVISSVNQIQYAVIFQTHTNNNPAWMWMFNLPAAQYQQQLQYFSSKGYRPTCVSAVTLSGQQYFGAIWQQSNTVWQTQWGLSTQTIQSVGQQFVNQGYQFSGIQGYVSTTGTVLYSALWDQNGL